MPATASADVKLSKPTSGNYLVPTIIIGILFFVFGFVTWLNSTLINFLKIACEIDNYIVLFFVTFAFYISYFVMAIPSARVLKITGFKNGMSVGLVVMAIGALIFIPAALTRTYGLFLLGLFVQGTGLSILQTASNPYITILGPIESAAKRISIMGIFNKTAGALSPIVLSALILAGADALETKLKTVSDLSQRNALLNSLASRVILPYVVMAVVLVILALAIRFSNLPEVENVEEEEEKGRPDIAAKKSILDFPFLILGAITLFFYVGVEVLAGDTIATYGTLLGFKLDVARYFPFFTMSGMVIGYIIGIITIPRVISQKTALQICSVLGLIFSVMAILTSGYTSIVFIALLGLANSLMWPAIWPLAINGLGHFTKTGSALLIMAIAGGAVLPLIFGSLANVYTTHPQMAYLILLPAYVIILWYAVYGHKVMRWKKN